MKKAKRYEEAVAVRVACEEQVMMLGQQLREAESLLRRFREEERIALKDFTTAVEEGAQ